MGIETVLRSLDRGVLAARGNEYIWSLIDGRLEEYLRVFEIQDTNPEEARNLLIEKIADLLDRLENELVAGSGVILLRKRIDQESRGPEYALGWLKAELPGWIEWTRKRVRSSLLLQKKASVVKSVLNALFPNRGIIKDDLEERTEQALKKWQHRHESVLTETGGAVLCGYLEAQGRDSLDRRILQNKKRIQSIVGPAWTYDSR